jgi:putative ABC transport system permease protein
MIGSDLRAAVRALRKRRGFTLLAASTLALGVGTNAALFSVVDRALLHPLELPDADRLVIVQMRTRGELRPLSGPNLGDLHDATADVFVGLAGITSSTAVIENPDGTREVQRGVGATPDVFRALGVPLQLGRPWGAEAQGTGAVSTVVLTDRLWRSRFGADPAVVGGTILLDGSPVVVSGVMAEGFDFPTNESAGFIHPLVVEPSELARDNGVFDAIGRVRDGISRKHAAERLAAVWDRLRRQFPETVEEHEIALMGLHAYLVRAIRPGLLALLAGSVLLLVLACANVANLLLARGLERRVEMATRASLGAGRGRLVRLLLAEGMALAAIAGVLGLLLAGGLLRSLGAMAPPALADLADVRLSGSASALGLAMSTGCAVLAALLPAVRGTTEGAARALVVGTAARPGRRRRLWSLQSALVVAQLSMAVVLAVGAGLLARSFATLAAVDPGYRTDGVLTAAVAMPGEIFYSSREARTELVARLEDAVADLPGVTSVGTTLRAPFAAGRVELPVRLADRPASSEAEAPRAELGIISAGYLEALGIPVLRGRALTAEDAPGAPRVALVSARAAGALFGDQDPIGRRLAPVTGRWEDDPAWAEVVGVVGDIRLQGLDAQAHGTVYLSMRQRPQPFVTLVVRADGALGGRPEAVRDALLGVEPTLPVPTVTTLASTRSASLARPRFHSTLLGVFAVVATTLAVLGVYGLLSHSVAARRGELGVRMAIGADRVRLVRLILGDGLLLATAGIGIGLLVALTTGRALRGLLYEVAPNDPTTYAAITLGIGASAVIGCLVPAWRAARADPVESLRRG